MFYLLTILPCLLLMFQPLNAKIDPPNYILMLDALGDFSPGKNIQELDRRFGKGIVMNESGNITVRKYLVAPGQHQFSVMVQGKDDKILDFYTKLPSHFSHDEFLRKLIEKFGKQDSFKKLSREAVYTWTKDSNRMVYSGACTITCYPQFFTFYLKDFKDKPLIEQMKLP